MDPNNMKSALLAILFASGEPIGIDKLAQALSTDKMTVTNLATELEQDIKKMTDGICLISLEDKYQLCTNSDYMIYIKNAMELKRNTPLSQAAMEVLAVICYNQPVTKSFVEQVRGVECSGVFTTLVEKGLIEERGRLELPGRPLIYGTTDVFLRCFNLPSLDYLPPLPHMDAVSNSEQQTLNSILEDAQRSAQEKLSAAKEDEAEIAQTDASIETDNDEDVSVGDTEE